MLVSGYMPLTLWRHLTNRTIFLVRRNIGLLYHRKISVLNVFVTTLLLEFIGCTLAFIVNYTVLVFINLLDPIQDYTYVICGWCLMAAPAIGLGAAIAVLTEKYEASERFIAPLQYLILPVSGFFFMVDWLPEYAQKLAWYMPTVHSYEMVRHGFFGDSVQTYYNAAYPLVFGLVLLAIFVPMLDRMRDHVPYG